AGRAATTTEEAGGAATVSDQQIAALIFGAAHNEIEVAKFAQTRLQSEHAKQFAEKMIRDHQPGCDAMKRMAGNLVAHETAAHAAGYAPATGAAAGANAGSRTQVEGARAGETAAVEPAAGRVVRDGGPAGRSAVAGTVVGGALDWVSIHQQIGAQCLE